MMTMIIRLIELIKTIDIPKILELSLAALTSLGIVKGIDYWRKNQEKAKAKGMEIDNEGKKIDNRKKKIEIDRAQMESLMATIRQLKEDNETFNKRLNEALREAEEMYKKYDDCRDEKMQIEDEKAKLYLAYKKLERDCNE